MGGAAHRREHQLFTSALGGRLVATSNAASTRVGSIAALHPVAPFAIGGVVEAAMRARLDRLVDADTPQAVAEQVLRMLGAEATRGEAHRRRCPCRNCPMTEHCDVVVIGAGPAGCATAIRLAESGHDVVLLEREAGVPDEDRTSGECIPPSTQVELELLGIPTAGDWVLDHFAATRNVFPDGRWITFPFPDGFRYYNIHRPGSRSPAAGARDRRPAPNCTQRRARAATSSSQPTASTVRGDDERVRSPTAHRRGWPPRADLAAARPEDRRARGPPDRGRASSSPSSTITCRTRGTGTSTASAAP